MTLDKARELIRVQLGFGGLGFFNGDDAFIADLLHGFSDHLADFTLAIGGDGADLGNFFRGVDRLRAVADTGAVLC